MLMRDGASSRPACAPRALIFAAVSSHPRRISLEETRRPTGANALRCCLALPNTLAAHSLASASEISGGSASSPPRDAARASLAWSIVATSLDRSPTARRRTQQFF